MSCGVGIVDELKQLMASSLWLSTLVLILDLARFGSQYEYRGSTEITDGIES
jgi:hypothetical protein